MLKFASSNLWELLMKCWKLHQLAIGQHLSITFVSHFIPCPWYQRSLAKTLPIYFSKYLLLALLIGKPRNHGVEDRTVSLLKVLFRENLITLTSEWGAGLIPFKEPFFCEVSYFCHFRRASIVLLKSSF